MPIYEYECDCGAAFDSIRPIADRDKAAACPECGRSGRRVMSLPNIWTDDNNPLKNMQYVTGTKSQTRADVKQMEKDGIVMTSERDRDVVNRNRGKGATRELENVIDRANAPIKVS